MFFCSRGRVSERFLSLFGFRVDVRMAIMNFCGDHARGGYEEGGVKISVRLVPMVEDYLFMYSICLYVCSLFISFYLYKD